MKDFKNRAELRQKISDQLENNMAFRDYSFAPIRLLGKLETPGALQVPISENNWHPETLAAVSLWCLERKHGSIIFFI